MLTCQVLLRFLELLNILIVGTLAWEFHVNDGKGFLARPVVTSCTSLSKNVFVVVVSSTGKVTLLEVLASYPERHRSRSLGQIRPRWIVDLRESVQSTPAFLARDGFDGSVFVGTESSRMVRLRLSSGAVYWDHRLPGESSIVFEPVINPDGDVIAFGQRSGAVWFLATAKGKTLRKLTNPAGVWGAPYFQDNNRSVIVFTVTASNLVKSVMWTTGEVLWQVDTMPMARSGWKQRVPDWIFPGPHPLGDGKTVVIASNDGWIRGFDLNGKGITWKVNVGDAVASELRGAPLGAVFGVSQKQGRCFRVDASDTAANVTWIVELMMAVPGSVALGAGSVFVAGGQQIIQLSQEKGEVEHRYKIPRSLGKVKSGVSVGMGWVVVGCENGVAGFPVHSPSTDYSLEVMTTPRDRLEAPSSARSGSIDAPSSTDSSLEFTTAPGVRLEAPFSAIQGSSYHSGSKDPPTTSQPYMMVGVGAVFLCLIYLIFRRKRR